MCISAAVQECSDIPSLEQAHFEAEVIHSKQPVLLAFWAPWSQVCQPVRAALEQVAAACASRVKIFWVNVDDNPDLGVWYDIQSIPTLVYFTDGMVRAKIVGTASLEVILAKLQLSPA
jgi:thioredoxin-like negative regulator of GroEL